MSVLVTGGAGYIGSHTAKALHTAGVRPVVYDNLSAGHQWAVKWGPFVRGDLADSQLLRSTIRQYDVRAVIHFAAFAYVGESMQQPGRYFNNNVANSIHLLEAMQEEGIRRIVFSSSCATYGIPAIIPIAEDHPQAPVNPYGDSKLMVEKILRWYGEIHGLSWVALRYFNAAGADPQGEIGERHDPETHLIPLALGAAAGTAPPLHVYGSDYHTPDGSAVRDYIHVSDLASAHVLALQYLEMEGASRAFNLGTGTGTSVLEIISGVQRLTGRNVPVRQCGRRAGDPPILIASAAQANAVLGWRPHFSGIESILETAWRWQRAGEIHS